MIIAVSIVFKVLHRLLTVISFGTIGIVLLAAVPYIFADGLAMVIECETHNEVLTGIDDSLRRKWDKIGQGYTAATFMLFVQTGEGYDINPLAYLAYMAALAAVYAVLLIYLHLTIGLLKDNG